MGIDNYVVVEGYPNLVRDKRSNAIINTDSVAIMHSKHRQKLRREREQKDMTQKDRLDNLEKDISEIKRSLELLISNMHK